jgi:hypothetical protein
MPTFKPSTVAMAALVCAYSLCGVRHAQAQAAAPPKGEQRSSLDDQLSVAVTIYNQDLALVKEVRKPTLDAGISQLALRDVSALMRPETAQLRSLSHPGSISLLEQNFDFDLLTQAKLLEKYVGGSVRVVKTHPSTGVETVETAQVLSANNGVVLHADQPKWHTLRQRQTAIGGWRREPGA